MNANGQQQKTHHVCFEGTLACSGVNPCPHCLDVVNREVLAQAMKRTTETLIQQRGPQGSIAMSELNANSFWAIFYGFYANAWQDLHDAMKRDPEVERRAFDLRTLTVMRPPPAIAPAPAPMPARAPLPPPHPAQHVFNIPNAATFASPPVPVPHVVFAPAVAAPFPFAAAAPAIHEGAPPIASAPMHFPLRELADVQATPSADVQALATDDDGSTDSLFQLMDAPLAVRHEITADDIAGAATILEGAAAPANGASVATP